MDKGQGVWLVHCGRVLQRLAWPGADPASLLLPCTVRANEVCRRRRGSESELPKGLCSLLTPLSPTSATVLSEVPNSPERVSRTSRTEAKPHCFVLL